MNQNSHDPTETQSESIELFCRAMAKALSKEAEGYAGRQEEAPVQTINLVALFFRILENLKYVVLCAVVMAVLGGCYAKYTITPTYSATAKLYILGQAGSSINLNSLQIGTVLTMDYQEVFKTWEVHEMVRQELDLPYNYGQLQSMLTVTNPEDTRVLYITVVHTDAQLAADIANAYAKAAKTFILETMDSEAPSSFSVALTPGNASAASKSSYIALGFLFGTLLSVGIIALHFVFDDRPRGPEDVEEVCGLPTLAVIPAMKPKTTLPGQAKER